MAFLIVGGKFTERGKFFVAEQQRIELLAQGIGLLSDLKYARRLEAMRNPDFDTSTLWPIEWSLGDDEGSLPVPRPF